MIEYLVAHGSERAVDDIIEHTFQISVRIIFLMLQKLPALFSLTFRIRFILLFLFHSLILVCVCEVII